MGVSWAVYLWIGASTVLANQAIYPFGFGKLMPAVRRYVCVCVFMCVWGCGRGDNVNAVVVWWTAAYIPCKNVFAVIISSIY